MTTRWKRLRGRDPKLLACLLALVIVNLLMLVSDLAHIEWLMWIVAAAYVVAVASFIRGQVVSYRLTAQRFPIPAAPPAQSHEHPGTGGP